MSFYEEVRLALPERLPAYLSVQRWFGGKARKIRSAELLDLVPLQTGEADAYLLLARVEYESGPGDTYVLPMIFSEAAIGRRDRWRCGIASPQGRRPGQRVRRPN